MSKKKIITLQYYKLPWSYPLDRVPLMRFGEWCEVWRGEVILAHKEHAEQFKKLGLIPCKGYSKFRTIKEALKSRKQISRQRFTE